MKILFNPERTNWQEIMKRPEFQHSELQKTVSEILLKVKNEGDKAIRYYSEKFDHNQLENIQVSEIEIEEANRQIDQNLKKAIHQAKENIEKFHETQQEIVIVSESTPGVKCWRQSVAIEKVGLYIPGGTAPLFSTVLMLAIPANIAGCKEVVLCSPAGKNGKIHPAILYTANLCGVKKIFKVGGAQAIAAMAYGTETIPKIYKIFGPGNQFVTQAKTIVNQQGTAIDMPAGPSEVMVVADESANPQFVAADLLSQAEHGIDSQVILLTNNKEILENTIKEVEKQLETLPRRAFADEALEHSHAIFIENEEDIIDFMNEYAPEHLILAVKYLDEWADKVINAGSVFLGNFTPEAAGDYASGTNHTLPTNGYARTYSGVSLDSFIRKITFQQISKEGIRNLGNTLITMAEAEDLYAHGNAVRLRM